MTATPTGAPLWQHSLGRRLPTPRCYPAYAGDLIALPSDDGVIIALRRADGSPAWSYSLPEASATHSLASDGQRIFVGPADTRPVPRPGRALLALDAASGAVAWQLDCGAHSYSAPSCADNTVFCTSADGQVHAIDAATGRRRWSAPHPDWGPAAPAVGAGVVVAGGRGDLLLAYDQASGRERWRFQGGGWFASRPSIAAGLVFVRCWDGNLYALDAATGKLRWQLRGERGQGFTSTPVFAAGLLLIGDRVRDPAGGYALRALDPANGRERWRFATQRYVSAAPLAADDTILCLAEEGAVYALAAADGALRWQFATAAAPVARLAADDQVAHIADREGNIYAIGLGLRPSTEPERPPAEDLAVVAERHERAGELAEALMARIELEQWDRVAALAEHLGDDEHAGEAYEHLGRSHAAATAYERAARRPTGVDERLQADLFERAARLFESAFDTERAEACQREVRRLRQLPELRIVVTPPSHFSEGEWNTVQVDLSNAGFGPARAIQLRSLGHFELNEAPVLAGIAPQREARQIISLRPLPGERGQRVPLELAVSFRDTQNRLYELAAPVSFVPVLRRGAALPLTSEPAPQPAPAELTLSLRFSPSPDAALVSWESEAFGNVSSRMVPPYRGDDVDLVVRALEQLQTAAVTFAPAELERLAALGIPIVGGTVQPTAPQAIGRALYQALAADPVAAAALLSARNLAINTRRTLDLRLHFPQTAVELAALPWELLWDQSETPVLLSGQQVAGCSRHLDVPMALPAPRPRGQALRILVVAPHAGIDADTRAQEQAERSAALAPLIASAEVVVQEVSPATRRALVDAVQAGPPPDIVHFVGHGRYTDGKGWLILDGPGGKWDRVPVGQLTPLFSGARLVVLCACQGGMAGEAGLLTGVAPALSAAGVPAVVAMQLSVRQSAAIRFSEVMYRGLARGEPLQRAVVQARQALYIEDTDGASWYVPTLTIRTRDLGPLYLFGS